jgi:putative membrane protein (TIGR04086 family)
MQVKHKRRTTEQNDISLLYILKQSLIFIPLFLLIGFVLSLITALIFFKSEDPTSKIKMASIISLYGSAFICSLFFTKKLGDRNVLAGFIYSLLLFIIVYAVSLILNGGSGILIKLGIIGVSLIAGMITKKRVTKKIKHKRLR